MEYADFLHAGKNSGMRKNSMIFGWAWPKAAMAF